MSLKDFLKKAREGNQAGYERMQSGKESSNYSESHFDKNKYDKMREKINKHFERNFDFNTFKGISSIPVKPYIYLDEVTGSISYVLQRKATEHKKNNRMDLAIACLKKSNEIAPLSKIKQTEAAYMRLVAYLLNDGQFDEARKEFDSLRSNGRGPVTTSAVLKDATFKDLKRCEEIGTDLIQMSYIESACGECAKYRGRVFSISGKDRRYPKLPAQVFAHGGIHDRCGCGFYPYEEGESCVWDSTINLLAFSNRPFVDDRSVKEKEAYRERMSRINKLTAYDEEWFEKTKQKSINKMKKQAASKT